jgi:hypothetical protein
MKYSMTIGFFLPILYRDSPGTINNQEAPIATNPMDQGKTGESKNNDEEARLSMT